MFYNSNYSKSRQMWLVFLSFIIIINKINILQIKIYEALSVRMIGYIYFICVIGKKNTISGDWKCPLLVATGPYPREPKEVRIQSYLLKRLPQGGWVAYGIYFSVSIISMYSMFFHMAGINIQLDFSLSVVDPRKSGGI